MSIKYRKDEDAKLFRLFPLRRKKDERKREREIDRIEFVPFLDSN